MARKRGAPRGNTNALKHGFYSKQFRDQEWQDLDAVETQITDEVVMLRVYLRRLLVLADNVTDIDTMQSILATVGVTSSRIAKLLQTHQILTGNDSNLSTSIEQALSEVLKEMSLT
jgi:hypothetical protein